MSSEEEQQKKGELKVVSQGNNWLSIRLYDRDYLIYKKNGADSPSYIRWKTVKTRL